MSATTTVAPPAPAEDAEPKQRTTRTANPELQVMAKIDRLLTEELTDDAARARVVRWMAEYYGPTLADRIEQGR